MANTRFLKNPPIKEAYLSVSFKNTVEVERLKAFCENDFIKENFPEIRSIMAMGIRLEAQKKPSSQSSQHGFVLISKDKKTTINIRIGQLSLHNTNEYLGWEVLFQNFKNIWTAFCKTIGPMDLVQISTRYINELDLNLDKQGFSSYLHFIPYMPDNLTTTVHNFFMQVTLPSKKDDKIVGVLTETVGASEKQGHMKLILDTNVFIEENFVCNSDEMWEAFKNIRNFKNELFFSCVTDKALQPYE